MTLTEEFIKDHIYIDFNADILFEVDETDEDCPVRFPMVYFQLHSTIALTEIADRIRKNMGFKPMYPMDEYTDETCDNEGWYEFCIEINSYAETKVASHIDFIVTTSESPDNDECYTIELDETEQKWIYARLDEQCREYLEQSCEELLEESRRRMEKDIEDHKTGRE